jgi:formylglycine-generating enzyme required for sulfatase activity
VDIYDGYALIAPVASFLPNPWGLYDMHGNVDEWCWDLWEQYTSAAQIDPVGAYSGYLHIIRGGSCFGDAEDVRSANRSFNTSTFPNDHIGFRIAKSY